MKITKEFTTTITLHDDFLGNIDLPFEPYDEDDIFLSADRQRLTYLVQDAEGGYDYEFPEGVEFVQGSNRYIHYVSDATAWLDRVNEDPNLDVFPVDVYEHGAIMYSLTGSGPQCDFDTARGGAAIAIPRDFTDTEEAARAILAEYTDWCNGVVFGVVEMNRAESGDWEQGDSVWGFIGYEHAVQEAKGWVTPALAP